jgi:Glycosyl transferase family 90
VLPAFVLSVGAYFSLEIWDGVNSTYICPIAVGEQRTIPLMQWANLAIDAFIIIALYETALNSGNSTSRNKTRPFVVWAFVLFVASVVWAIAGTVVYLTKPHYRRWLIPLNLLFSTNLIPALLWQTILFSTLAITTAFWILRSGILDAAMTLTTVLITIPCLHLLWTAGSPYPPISTAAATLPLITTFTGIWAYNALKRSPGHVVLGSTLFQIAVVSVSLAILWAGWTRRQHVYFHPIDDLIFDAKMEHDQYSSNALKSLSLADAVDQYRVLYHMSPPPDFDIWYQYATNRSAIVIDEFDQIYNDLLLFRAIPPADLRRQTWEMVSNPWNEISGIVIRNGNATVQENVLPTHQWMLEGVAILINSFALYLPDMDLAFNLNDEPRVSVPFSDVAALRELISIPGPANVSSWSADRSSGWLPIPEHEYKESIFQDSSFRNTFVNFGSVGCSPQSEARKNPIINSRSHICLRCAAPHSLGQFLANWTQAADICHQPDLAHLHGFYMSPAAFKCSHQLMPVFSQSKPHGFNDILYPSAWNYMDKAVYAPSSPSGKPGSEDYNPGFPDHPFAEKESVLFWRGATSEGVSSGDHAWRGMTRQRLVHMANNLTNSAHDRVTILLPDPAARKGRLKYQTIRGTDVESLGLSTNISIVDGIARCGGIGLHDCTDQDAEFGFAKPTDFQSHWQYKYLFDLDGAAFSGRFLPFLQSRSLPFKTALFREWYDSRITAWQHFVPQDLRLHGVWSTLAYFAGVDGKINGKQVTMKPHPEEGEAIATAGREWAAKVLRKEDMEIYFFRLLLEWARLTDDRRDELGFVL